MKKITLLFLGLVTMIFQINAQVEIGTGNLETENGPFEAYFGYSYVQTIYLASEINATGDITDIQWYYSGTTALPNSQDLVIYMAELPRDEFADTNDWEPITSFTQVYAGGITVTAGVEGWVTLTLDSPFTYTGTGNLVVAVEENSAGFDAFSDDFYNTQVTTNRSISYFSDGFNPDPTAPPTASNIDDTIANIILGGIAQSCPTPTSLNAEGVTSNQANLSWMENGSAGTWNVEIVPEGSTQTEMPTDLGVSNPFLATGLMPATNYTYYVQADCGGEVSSWAGPFAFATECVTFTAPYTEGFENGGAIPLCWSMDGGEDWFFDDDPGFNHIGNNGDITGTTATNGYFAWCDSSGDEGPRTLTSPLVDVSGLTTPALSFYLLSDNEGNANSNLDVEVWDGAAWNPLGTYNSNTGGWTLVVLDLSTLTITGDVQARFVFSEIIDPSDFYDDIAIDDVTFDEAPSCFNPSALAANAITSNGAELSWSQDGMVASWNIEIVTSGTPPTGTPTESGVSNPYTASGLMAITSYDYYVQADCGGDLSGWTGPFSFETLCDVFIPDYIEQFGTIIPDCWEEAEDGDAASGPTNIGDGSWVADGFLNNGTTGAYKINLFTTGKSDWIISPSFDLTGGPFQVEFDFAITNWNSSTVAGTLGSDDTVELYITTDNGTTWTSLLTFNSTSVVPITGITPVVTLEAYAGQTVRFAILGSEGSVDDPEDIDVFVDDFRVRGIPTCPEPIDLASNNLSLTETEVSWTEVGSSAVWNIEYGPTGFTLGTGTVISGVTNPATISGLMEDTEYDFYVQAVCDPMNLSSFAGPSTFYTGYCESVPTSNDGDGVNNVTIGVTDFPSFGDVTYENQTTPVVNVFQGINTNVIIEFGHAFTYDTNIWIDFDDNLVFDASELVFQGESSGDGNPHILDASFVMPITATIGQHRMRIGTADTGQATPNPCYNGTWGVTLDFTVNVQELTCTLPEASFTTVPDCDNDQFFIEVDVTSLGDATSLEISNDFDASTVQADAIGAYQAGPFPFGNTVKVFVMNQQDNNCIISSEFFTVLACPPDNDECGTATVAVVNETDLCSQVTPGTILAATPSGVPNGSCTGNPTDDVWFEFTALNEAQFISLNNIQGGTFNLDHALYEGTCDGLIELYCSTETASIASGLVVGNTYYIRIFSGGSSPETSTFDLCIREAPTNTICESAENFCAVGDALVGSNIVGLPDPTDVACLGSVPNPSWNIIQIGESGLIEIEIVQWEDDNNNGIQDGGEDGLDVDFAVWGPFTSVEQACMDIELIDCPSCPFSNNPDTGFYPFGNIVDCSYSAAPIENLTIDNAVAGEIYMLLVTNFSDDAGVISIEQTNVGDPADGVITAEIEAEIISNEVVFVDHDSNPGTPVEASVCGFNSVTIQTDSPFADEFVWFEDGFEIIGETSSTLTVPNGGFGLGATNYQVLAIDNQCASQAYSQIVVVNLYEDPGTVAQQSLVVCDGPIADGVEEFDLNQITVDLGFGPDFAVSYYTNMTDANLAMNAVGSPYSSSGETLIIRVEDVDAANNGFLGCRQLSEVVLTVNPNPVINQPMDFVVCDDADGNVDGVTEFDLTSINSEVTTDTNITITYHNSQEDADNDVDAIASPYSSGGETIYVRAEDNTTGCHSTTTFNLVVNVVPLAEFDAQYEYEVCPNATVPVTIGILPSNFTEADVTINWFLDGSPIVGNGLTLDTVLVQGEYSAEISFNVSGCSNTIMATVIELPSCIFPQGISPGVTPGQNDTFDLSSFGVVRLEIFNRNGTLVYSKNNYIDEWEGQTNDGEELPVGTYFYTMIYENGAKKRSSYVYINR